MRPRLDLDVLLEIFRFSDMATQSQIMKTCRILSREGGQLLVRRNKVSLSTDVEMESFLRFMRADGHARIPHLRTLALHSSVVHTSSQTTEMRITLLSDLVRWNTGLKRLTCECTNDDLPLDLRLARSIAQLTTLTNLSIYYVDHPTWAILQSMRSRLTDAHIQFYNADHDIRAPPSHELDLMRFLQGSRKTLRSLWLEVSNLTAIVTSAGPVYPCMRELDIKSATPWISVASHLIQAFPRLEVLDIEDDETWASRPDVDSPQCVASRAANRTYQQAHRSWKRLTYFRGEARHLYSLAPTCRIQHLFIDEIGLSVDATVLRAMLADARPTILKLGLNVNEHFLREDWLSALCEPRTPQVQVITVKMGLRGEQEEMDMERAIVSAKQPSFFRKPRALLSKRVVYRKPCMTSLQGFRRLHFIWTLRDTRTVRMAPGIPTAMAWTCRQLQTA